MKEKKVSMESDSCKGYDGMGKEWKVGVVNMKASGIYAI
jgi:hypothetical protein